ncbi:MAG: ATP-binding protein [Actinomycetota bacterium]
MPKILVSGRGGSGKSTVVSLLALQLSASVPILVVDADESNLGLPLMLGLPEPPHTLMDWLGGKSAVREKLMAMLRGTGGEDMSLFDPGIRLEDLPESCKSARDGLSLVRIGKIEHSMEGCACPMGVVARAFIKSLNVDTGSWVLVDTEAGIEHFGRGVLEGIERVLLVVDPSREAVILAQKASRLCEEAGKPYLVVVNRSDTECSASLLDMLLSRGLTPRAFIDYSPAIARANLEGTSLEAGELENAILEIISALKEGA